MCTHPKDDSSLRESQPEVYSKENQRSSDIFLWWNTTQHNVRINHSITNKNSEELKETLKLSGMKGCRHTIVHNI